jgi:hypothetical protein
MLTTTLDTDGLAGTRSEKVVLPSTQVREPGIIVAGVCSKTTWSELSFSTVKAYDEMESTIPPRVLPRVTSSDVGMST